MGKLMKICLEVARKTEELTVEGLEFNAALRKAKEIYNFNEMSKRLDKQREEVKSYDI